MSGLNRFSEIGKPTASREAAQQVTGAMKYAGDLRMPGLLTGVVLRSPCAYGRILHIDASAARRLPGVRLVLTARDIPPGRFGRYLKDQPLLAGEVVLYAGEPVAVIAAVDEDTAEYAKEIIRVDLEPMNPVFDSSESLLAGAPLLHPDLRTYTAAWPAVREGNVCSRSRAWRGDIEEGFAGSELVVESVFDTPVVHQCPIETQVAIAWKDQAGRLRVSMPTQLAFANQFMIADALKIDPAAICVSATPSGGSFGSKIENMAGLYASLLAWNTEKPVRVRFSRKEEFLAVTPRHASKILVRTGVRKDGTLMAWQTRVLFDTGAYAWSGPVVTGVCTMFSAGPYRIPHLDLEGRCVYTNKIPCGAFRGYGNPQAAFAHESQMDIVARSIGMDPVELRLKNAVVDGDTFTLGNTYSGVSLGRTIELTAEKAGWKKRHELGSGHGKGIACFQHVTGGLPSSAILKANLDGTVSMLLGTPEIGTAVSTMASQIASEVLSIPIEHIRVLPIDTDTSPYDHGLGISRSCFNVGHAVRLASEDLRGRIFRIASDLMHVDEGKLRLAGGMIFIRREGGEESLSLRDFLARAFYAGGGPLIGTGSYLYSAPSIAASCEGMPISGFPQVTFGTQSAEVKVDLETGKIKVLKIVATHDTGKTINPNTVKGQIYGGVVQGVGYALTEELKFVDGKVVNNNLRDYKIPTAPDTPPIEIAIVEMPDPAGPFGAKGVGEPPIVPTAAAIANAVEDAAGIRIKSLPITPERVLKALKQGLR